MVDPDRDRLVNATLFFSESFPRCRAKWLFVGLYLLDVRHFQNTGRSVTGAEYLAGYFGPYPVMLAHELREFVRPDLAGVIQVEHVPGLPSNDLIHPLKDKAPVDDLFSARELGLLKEVASSMLATDLEDLRPLVERMDGGAWRAASRHKKHHPIRLEDTLDPNSPHYADLVNQARLHRGRAEQLRRLAA